MIAFDYGISPRTVEIYRANVMTKMEASSLSAPVRMAILGGTARWHELTGRTTQIEPDHGDD